jgi:hypothetical protein
MFMIIGLRVVAFLLFLILVAFALLQINDPDPILWTSYYLLCSLVPLLLLFNRYNRVLFWICISLTVIVMGIYAAGTIEYLRHSAEEALMQSMNPQKPYIEEAREFIGGLIVLVFLFSCRFFYKLSQKLKQH